MSDLKHLTLEQLESESNKLQSKIGALTGKINNLQTRWIWVNKYIKDKTPVEYTQFELDTIMGHPVVLREVE